MNCTYYYNGVEYDSFESLYNLIEKLNINFDKLKISDIVYSKSDLAIHQENLIKTKKQDYIQGRIADLISGERSIDGKYSVLDFINSPIFTRNDGHPFVTPYNIDNYREESKKQLTNNGIDEQEAEKQVAKMIENLEKVRQDSFELHPLFTSSLINHGSASEFYSKHKTDLNSRLNKLTLIQKLHADLNEKFKYECNGRSVYTNINLSAQLTGLDKEVIGHIDWLFVGDDGVLHLYLFKTTSQNPRYWPNVKKETYNYQLSLLKRILAHNGFNVTNIDLNIIPVQLKYNNAYSEIKSIEVGEVLRISSRNTNTGYALAKYDKDVKKFITSNTEVLPISDDVIESTDKINKLIFPEVNIRRDGIHQSTLQWIQNAPDVDPEGSLPLVIKYIGDNDYAYEVIINGRTHKIKSKDRKDKNKEIYDVVKKYVTELEDEKGYIVLQLKDAIKKNKKIVNDNEKEFSIFDTIKGIKANATYFEAALYKYLYDYTIDPITLKKEYLWELMDDLIDAGVLIFKNKQGIIDVITLSSFYLPAQFKFLNGSTNILGCHKRDSEFIKLKGDYGNIEAVRTMVLVNQMLPKLGEVTLGTMSVLSAIRGDCRKFDFGYFNQNYFLKIVNTVNNDEFKNNFNNATFSDMIENVLNEYQLLTEGHEKTYEKYEFQALNDAKTKALQLAALQSIMNNILLDNPNLSNPEIFDKLLNSHSLSIVSKNLARLYALLTEAYVHISGETPKFTTSLSKVELLFITPNTISSENIRTVVNNLLITHDTISAEFMKEFDSLIGPLFKTYYDSIGYTAAQNMAFGNQAQQFSNLIEDKELMIFKNPYDKNNNLTLSERDLLKKVLHHILYINSNKNINLDYNNETIMIKYIKQNPDYLWVPLERASKATSRQSKDAIVAKMKNWWKRAINITERFDEFVNGVTSEERGLLGTQDDDFYNMTVKNPFSLSLKMTGDTYNNALIRRKQLLSKYTPAFFETNVENILIDVLAKQLSTTLLNKFLVATKALLFQMLITGDHTGSESVTQREIDYIQKYLKVNVFKTTIMDKTELAIVGAIMPVKNTVTNILLGGNLVSAVRDTIEGLEQIFIRSVIKLNTDINPKAVRLAYLYVMTHSTSNAMAVNLLSKLCLKYRLSNVDVGRIAERAKTGRNGLFNYDNWMYSTLRGPDFLNRMTLFVAKCMHDGVWDAYSIDENNNLKYNWKKDLRFKAYAENDRSDMEAYNKAKSLYLSKVKQYKEDHPDEEFDEEAGLQTPYSDIEIMSIRAIGDNIFGAYDKSKKAMVENQSYGILFGMFTTWMNGIVNNYFMKPQENNVTSLVYEQETDTQGRKLYWTDDGEIKTLEEGGNHELPVMKNVPTVVQGIFPMIATIVNICRNDGIDVLKAYINANPHEKANLKKLISDLLASLFFLFLYKCVLDPAYKDYKKGMKDNSILLNLSTEILYKASGRAYDLFLGPVNAVQFFSESMNPPYLTVPIDSFKQTMLTLMGEKSWKYLLFNHTGFTRSFKDTGLAYLKSQGIGEKTT